MIFLMLGLVLAACSPGSGTEPTVSDTADSATSSTTESSPSSQPDPEGTTTTESGETTTTSDRERAPDFTLALGEGGTYTLSEGTKPVFMVFWAEW